MHQYPWLTTIHRRILRSFQKGRGHHALLFNSKWNNGEDVLIDTIIRWLICSNPNDVKNCNVCYDCQLMNTGNHPDYYEFDIKHNFQSIGIDGIRVCIDAIYNQVFCSKVKVVFIKHTEYLTNQACNILLKIIEEPPKDTYFFFKTKEYINISPTLLSRCVRWNIESPHESLGLRWLAQQKSVVSKEDDIILVKCALRLCSGAPISAKDVLQISCWEQRLALCNAINDAIINNDFLRILPHLNFLYNDNVISIYWLITLLLDALKWHAGVKNFIINLDQNKLINMIFNRWDSISLSNQLQLWLMLIYYFQKFIYVDRELLLIYRLLNWQYDIIESDYDLWGI